MLAWGIVFTSVLILSPISFNSIQSQHELLYAVAPGSASASSFISEIVMRRSTSSML